MRLSSSLASVAAIVAIAVCVHAQNATTVRFTIHSARSGRWSESATWTEKRAPRAGDFVQVRAGHTVMYDVASTEAIRMIHLAGTLTFARDRSTRLDVGLIKIQDGAEVTEDGFACDAHSSNRVILSDAKNLPALEVGTQDDPIPANVTATIRLVYFEGTNKETLPAIINCGGRMDFHGALMNRTWVKLGAPATRGATSLTLNEPVIGWRVGDCVIVTATTRQNKQKKTFRESTRDDTQTEMRVIRAVNGATLELDRPLEFDHYCEGNYRGDVANLSRNVVVESAQPDGVRGHTMYHNASRGGIAYAEFRHLGKEGVLGKYSIHFHLVGDSMRGSSVVGASIWDSHNRWITIHGTNYLLVRDCVGYQSKGHGFFLEDGTETRNVLDRNLAVQAYTTKPLPKQVMPFDKNDGSGFWWANSLNTFTRNVAAECDEYGYFFQAAATPQFDLSLPVLQPDGSHQRVDIRTLPFIRFEDNEAHCQRRHSINLGGGVPFGEPTVAGVGPDERHPFVLRNLRLWNVHWAIHPVAPSVLLDSVDIFNAEYGVWRPVYARHSYRQVNISQVREETKYAFDDPQQRPNGADFPRPLQPVDDFPPVTIITSMKLANGQLLMRGVAHDNGDIAKIEVSRIAARVASTNAGVVDWEATIPIPRDGKVTARATDKAGNVEKMGHVREL